MANPSAESATRDDSGGAVEQRPIGLSRTRRYGCDAFIRILINPDCGATKAADNGTHDGPDNRRTPV
jgi:hypothetical protein